MKHTPSLLAVLTVLATAPAVSAALVMNLSQQGPDVVLVASGSIDLTGMSFFSSSASAAAFMYPSSGILLTSGAYDLYLTGADSAPSFGAGTSSSGSNNGGAAMGMWGGAVVVPAGYTSGTLMSNTSLFPGTTLAALGADIGGYGLTLNNGDTISLNVVPEASSALLGLAGAGLLLRRRRN